MEKSALTRAAVSILTCSMEFLPSEILLSTFHYRFRKHQSKLKEYHSCLDEVIPFYDEFKCSIILRPVCTERFNEDPIAMELCLKELNSVDKIGDNMFYIIEEQKYINNEILVYLHNKTVLKSMDRNVFDTSRRRRGTILDHYYDFITNTLKKGNYKNEELLGTYKTCMNIRRRKALGCLHHLKEPCEKAKVRVLKTIRMTLDNVLDVRNYIPSLKIIYNLRSPLGIANSRIKTAKGESYTSMYSQQKYVMNEVELVCKVMGKDFETYIKRNLSHSSVMLHQYEELCINTKKDVQILYDFVGIPVHKDVKKWLSHSSTSSKSKALKWRKAYRMSEYVSYLNRCRPYIGEYKYLLWDELKHVPKSTWRKTFGLGQT